MAAAVSLMSGADGMDGWMEGVLVMDGVDLGDQREKIQLDISQPQDQITRSIHPSIYPSIHPSGNRKSNHHFNQSTDSLATF
jgi:hypothetical protein